ncbi:MAG: hypothetical protein LBM04_10260 [Opitutaceae bacterium]|jgi:tetratricopeptide (TPR) repeat protein|nr:hypothetical protein [Opitutaceae bacterium]
MNGLFSFLCSFRKTAPSHAKAFQSFTFLFRIAAAATACLLLSGCISDGLRSYQRGKYSQACEQAVRKLRSKPDNANARTALMGAYPLAQAITQREIDSLDAASSIDRYEEVIAICDLMNKIAASILNCPPALALVPNPSDYTAARNAAAAIVVRRAYRAGVRASAVGTLAKAREALDYFTRVIRYSPNYRNVQARMEQARYDATLRVVVTRPRNAYLFDGDYLYREIYYSIHSGYLVRFYTPEEAVREIKTSPHRIVEFDVLDFTAGRMRETINTTGLVRNNVAIGFTTAPDGSRQTVFGDVKATYTTTRLEMQSKGEILMRIIDAETGYITYEKSYPGGHTWVSEAATFSGDERALDSNQLALTKRRLQKPPSRDDMFRDFVDSLHHDVAFDIGYHVE